MFRPVRRGNQKAGTATSPVASWTRIARRPKAPPFWRNIAPSLLAGGEAPVQTFSNAPIPLFQRQYYWRLVLSAKGIPYYMPDQSGRQGLYVPPAAERAALHEITAFEREKPDAPVPPPPLRNNALLAMLILCCLIPWHMTRWNAEWNHGSLPAAPETWLDLGGLDAYKVRHGEWWRAVTALTLHADAAHLAGNVLLGAVFCVPLFRRTGAGLGAALTVLAGACGNMLTAYLRPASYISQGFSSAVFAAVGLLSAVTAVSVFRHSLAQAVLAEDRQRQTHSAAARSRPAALRRAAFQGLMPLGAGLALLALLGGSEAPKADYLAHCMGLFCGTVLGMAAVVFAPALFRQKGGNNILIQTFAGGFAVALFAACWHYALA